jgi:hypothetical protein
MQSPHSSPPFAGPVGESFYKQLRLRWGESVVAAPDVEVGPSTIFSPISNLGGLDFLPLTNAFLPTAVYRSTDSLVPRGSS